jgi:hypothetical protein
MMGEKNARVQFAGEFCGAKPRDEETSSWQRRRRELGVGVRG